MLFIKSFLRSWQPTTLVNVPFLCITLEIRHGKMEFMLAPVDYCPAKTYSNPCFNRKLWLKQRTRRQNSYILLPNCAKCWSTHLLTTIKLSNSKCSPKYCYWGDAQGDAAALLHSNLEKQEVFSTATEEMIDSMLSPTCFMFQKQRKQNPHWHQPHLSSVTSPLSLCLSLTRHWVMDQCIQKQKLFSLPEYFQSDHTSNKSQETNWTLSASRRIFHNNTNGFESCKEKQTSVKWLSALFPCLWCDDYSYTTDILLSVYRYLYISRILVCRGISHFVRQSRGSRWK